jgi:hypothetical protein
MMCKNQNLKKEKRKKKLHLYSKANILEHEKNLNPKKSMNNMFCIISLKNVVKPIISFNKT